MSQTTAQLISNLVQALAFESTSSAPDNGVYLSAANTLSFNTNSAASPVLTIDSDGRLLVGVSSSFESAAGALLQIKPSASNTTPVISLMRNDTTITNNNNLGQLAFYSNDGDTPVKTAQITGAASQDHTSTARGTNLTFSTTETDTADAPAERMRIDSQGNVFFNANRALNRPRIILSTPDEGTDLRHLFGANLQVDTSGTFTTPATSISGGGWLYQSANSLDDHGNMIYLSAPDTNAESSTPLERLRIDNEGRLFVGTPNEVISSTNAKLQVVSDGGGFLCLARDDSTVETESLGGIIFLGNAADGTYQEGARILAIADGTHALGDKPTRLEFRTTADGESSPTTRMTIKEDGRLGIGTSSPGHLLHVKGTDDSDSGDVTVRIDAGTVSSASATNNAVLDLTARGQTSGGNARTQNCEIRSLGLDDAGGTLTFHTDDTSAVLRERMRIDSSGRVLLGTISNFTRGNLQVVDGGAGEILVARNDTSVGSGNDLGHIFFGANDGGTGYTVGNVSMYSDGSHSSTSHPSRLVFLTVPSSSTSALERMRINNDGNLYQLSRNHGISASVTASAGTSKYVFRGHHSGTDGNPLTGTISFTVWSNGNVENTNDSYGAISDVKLKENIVDAGSQWDDFKAVRFRKYNFKEETGYETFTQLGVIAQELETVCPGLVDETPDRDEDGNDLGTTTKSVKYSVLTKKALVALQEAMERIETLEAKVAALEAN